jgi:hypothetical protein
MRGFTYKPFALAIAGTIALAACSSGAGRLTPSLPQMPMSVQGSLTAPDAGSAVKKIVWGKLPAAKAGTAIKKAVKISLTAKGSNGKPISGTYAKPIVVTTTDKTGATKLFVNGKPANKKNPLKKSTDVLTMTYSGLAIVPATFEAASSKVKAKATFAPKLTAIAYAGPTVSGGAEIDLTSNTAGQSGYSGAFTATQTGWTPAPFSKAFAYTFAAIAGQTNNCPGTSGNAYTVSPGSGVKGTAFTISGAATAAAGECAMTISGGAGQKVAVILTYTATSVGINSTHH